METSADLRLSASAARFARALLQAVFDRKPFRVSFAIGVAGIAFVEQVPQLVDQNVVQVEILDRGFCPDQLPSLSVLNPPTTVLLCFVVLGRSRWLREVLDQRLFDGIQVQRWSPLHSVTRKALLFLRHPAELDDFERKQRRLGKLR